MRSSESRLCSAASGSVRDRRRRSGDPAGRAPSAAATATNAPGQGATCLALARCSTFRSTASSLERAWGRGKAWEALSFLSHVGE